MKFTEKTLKPRHEELNKHLIELGHERHEARKGMSVERSKQKNAWKKEVRYFEVNGTGNDEE